MRKSILACTVSFLMSPMASWSLGMGDVQINSLLNQPLKAEILIHSASKQDIDTLRVGLAPKNIYARANIERSDYLNKFIFKIDERDGKNYVTITTHKPFKEPYANFLVEASWKSGRLLREYTILLDPPEFVKQHAVSISSVSVSPASQVKRAKPAMTQPQSQPESNRTGSISNAGSIQSSTTDNQISSSDSLTYGPTKANDTLWSIANRMAPDNVTVDQMMMALLRDNPEAFINNNINYLKKGYVLRIKDPDSLQQLDAAMANNQVREQYQDWRDTRKQRANANIVDRSSAPVEQMRTDGELKLLSSGTADSSDTQGQVSENEQKLQEKLALTSEELESREIQNQELIARIKELEMMLETKTSLLKLKDESLAALQQQVEMQQQAAAEQSALAEMSEAPAEVSEAIETSPAAVVEPEMAAEEVTAEDTVAEAMETVQSSEPAGVTSLDVTKELLSPEEISQALAEHVDPSAVLSGVEIPAFGMEQEPEVAVKEQAVMEQEAAPEEPAIADITETDTIDEMVQGTDKDVRLAIEEELARVQTEAEVETDAPAETPEAAAVAEESISAAKDSVEVAETAPVSKTEKQTPAKTPSQAPQKGVVDTLLSSEMLPYTAGGAGLLIALFAWLGLRGRKKQDNEFSESILDSKLSDSSLDDNPSGKDTDVEEAVSELTSNDETSFLSDFSADDMESLQPDDTEADPISEADVFMVYGRYQQAEELLQNAIKKEPERLDYQMKLLEVYHGDNLRDSFALQAGNVRDLIQKSNSDYELTSEWTQARSWANNLGVNLDDDLSTNNAQAAEAVQENEPLLNDFSLDSDELENAEPVAEQVTSDFSLDDLDDELSLDDETTEKTDTLNLDTEFDNDDLDELTSSSSESTDSFSLDDDLELDENTDISDELKLDDADLDSDLNLDDDFSLDDSTTADDFSSGDSETINDFSLDDAESADDFNLDDSLDLEDSSLELEDSSLELEDNGSDSLDESTLSFEDDLDSGELLDLDDKLGSADDLSLDLDETTASLNESLDPQETSVNLNDSVDVHETSLNLNDALDLDILGETASAPDMDNELQLEEESVLNELSELEDDFDLDDSSLTSKIESENTQTMSSQLDFDDDLDLSDSSLELDSNIETSSNDAKDDLDASLDDLDLLGSDMDFDDLDGEFGEVDAVGTKIDLAKAYIDMGDMESATSILKEVIEEGNDEQKSLAQNLLTQTG